MKTQGIREGDIVEIDIRGQRAFARVAEPSHIEEGLGRRLKVVPLNGGRPLPSMFPTPRQIVGHYAKKGRK